MPKNKTGNTENDNCFCDLYQIKTLLIEVAQALKKTKSIFRDRELEKLRIKVEGVARKL